MTSSFGVYFEIQFNPQKNEDEVRDACGTDWCACAPRRSPRPLSTAQLMIRRQTLLDMIELHKKANPKEVLVGWFSTWTGGAPGPDGKPQHIDDFALVVQREIIADAAAKKGGVAHPIYLLVDTSLQTARFGMYTYLAVNNAMTAK